MREQIRQRIHEISNIPSLDITISPRQRLEYQNNNLYDVRFGDIHWIAKEFTVEDEFFDSPKREFDALQLLAPFDIAPTAIDYLPYPDFKRPVVIYEFMLGEMWDRRKPSQGELKQLAEIWLITHQATQDGLWYSRAGEETTQQRLDRHQSFFHNYIAWADKHFPEGIEAVKQAFTLYETQAKVIQNLNNARPTLLFSRSDPRFANIIARPDGRIGFVDWEDSGLRSPARTIANLILHPNQEDLLSGAEWQIFLNTYISGYPIQTDNLHDLIHRERLVMSLNWLGGLLQMGVRKATQGDLAGWQINGMPANQRLQRYYARAIGWATDDFEVQLANSADIRFFPECSGA